MNELQKIFIIIGIALFILVGIATMLILFSGFSLGGQSIAVVDMSGEVSGGGPLSDNTINPPLMREIFTDLKDDPDVVAVVLNINSGGGGVVESKEIARSLAELAEEKPVVAYIGDVGASGAYYIATFADRIVADQDSLVGSIGALSTHAVYKDLLEKKLGINMTVIKSGEFKDMGSPYRPMTEQEEERFQEIVDTIHGEFMDVVASNRGLSGEDLAVLNSSSIFLGSEALKLGLIDQTGGLSDAVDTAVSLAHSPDAKATFIDNSEYYKGMASYGMDAFYSMGRGLGDSLAARMQAGDWKPELK